MVLYSRNLDTEEQVKLGKTENHQIQSVCLSQDGKKIFCTGGEGSLLGKTNALNIKPYDKELEPISTTTY